LKAVELDIQIVEYSGCDHQPAFDHLSRVMLSQHSFDCIMIGAGIRALPQHMALFETIINAVYQKTPAARFCFNTNPGNTVVQRWV
jgi:hypothetical protein